MSSEEMTQVRCDRCGRLDKPRRKNDRHHLDWGTIRRCKDRGEEPVRDDLCPGCWEAFRAWWDDGFENPPSCDE